MSIITHTSWCDPNECIQDGDEAVHHRNRLEMFDLGNDFGCWFEIGQIGNEHAVKLGMGAEGDMTLPQVDEFIKALTAARDRLAQVH